MIAVDSSSMIAFLQGESGGDVEAVELALRATTVVLPPVVLSELLSDPMLPDQVANQLLQLPLLPLKTGFWERAGRLRAKILGHGNRARLADTLIAQCCIDADVPLIARDLDFRHFAGQADLRLVEQPNGG